MAWVLFVSQTYGLWLCSDYVWNLIILFLQLIVSRGIRDGFDTFKTLFNNLLWLVVYWSSCGTLGTHAVTNCTGDSTSSMDTSSYTGGNSSSNCLSYCGTACFNFNCSSRQCVKLIIFTSLPTLGRFDTAFLRRPLWLGLCNCYIGWISCWRAAVWRWRATTAWQATAAARRATRLITNLKLAWVKSECQQ